MDLLSHEPARLVVVRHLGPQELHRALEERYVRYIALSELGPDTIRRAARVHPIVDVQLEYSLVTRGPERRIMPLMAETGIAMTAYGVLSRGLLTGSKPDGPTDARAHMPRFVGENAEKNAALVKALAKLAEARSVTPAQLAIAWVRAKGKALGVTVIPTVGARTPAQLQNALGALDVAISQDDLASLEAAFPAEMVAGTRYPEAMMGMLDSER